MAIKYVGAKRIQGTAAEKPEAYYISTFSDDMDSSSGWTQVADDTAPSITGGKLVGTNIVLNNENRIHKAIGTTLSDTAWVLQAKLTIEAPNNNNGYFYPLVISNGNGDFNQATSVDMIFFLVDGSSATGYFRSQDGTTQTNVATGQGHVSTFWIDIIRDGSTMTMKGYTSSANQTSGTTSFNVNFTISGTVSGGTTGFHYNNTIGDMIEIGIGYTPKGGGTNANGNVSGPGGKASTTSAYETFIDPFPFYVVRMSYSVTPGGGTTTLYVNLID